VSPLQRKVVEESVPELGEVLEFLRTLWELDHALQSASKRMAKKRGVTGPQRLVLRILGKFPQLSPSQLAVILHLHPSTLTGVLKRLEDRKLLARRVDPRDRRRSFLGLTPKGRAVDMDSTETVESVVERLLTRLPRERVRVTQATLRRVSHAMEEAGLTGK
jgi:MarR family transcriptional regulator, organic hydroperoxide resistance regulator